MERQVIEAALAVVRATTPPATRAQASTSLEQWTRTDSESTWTTYICLLRLFFEGHHNNANGMGSVETIAKETASAAGAGTSNNISNDVAGVKLLLLTMLHAKIVRDVRHSSASASCRPELLGTLRDELLSCLTKLSGTTGEDDSLVSSLCSAAAAITVRSASPIGELVHACISAFFLDQSAPSCSPFSRPIALRLLSCVPEEVEECSDITDQDRKGMLTGGGTLEAILNALRMAILTSNGMDYASLALRVLSNWARTCQVTLSHLNAPPSSGGGESLLEILIRILSKPSPAEVGIVTSACTPLTESILITTDAGSHTRQEAIVLLLESIPRTRFLLAPFEYATFSAVVGTRWDNAVRAITIVASTLVCEEIFSIASCTLAGSVELVELLLRAQSHPSQRVAIVPLECWLTIQDVPTSDRHPDLAEPLFTRLLDILLTRIAYPSTFTTWEDELELDSQEFEELRRLVTDVLVSSYFLLRVKYVDRVVSAMDGSSWTTMESALFCLCAVSRDVCARVKARGGGSSSTINADKEATAQRLVQLAEQLCSSGAVAAAREHPLVLAAAATFVGSFAPVWNVRCSAEVILNLLAYLRDSMAVPEAAEAAAKSVRLIYIGCVGKLVLVSQTGTAQTSNPVLTCFSEMMKAVLSTDNEVAMILIAEGTTRLCVQLKDGPLMRRGLCLVIEPVLLRSKQAMDVILTSEGNVAQKEVACQALVKCLCIIKEVVRFCDNSSPRTDDAHPLSEVLSVLWPLLNDVASTPMCRQHEEVLMQVLSLHSQLLSNVPDMIAPHFSQLVTFVVQAYEETHLPCALDYVAVAVESFGGAEAERSFSQLLAHLSRCTCAYVTTEKRPNECPQVIRAFFDMAQRYLLFCAWALVNCDEFSTLFALAVACLSECQGERESTRASLNFLSQLIGWRALRLSDSGKAALETAAGTIDTCLVQHGESVTRVCFRGLSGALPQMLWPALSDCLFAVITHVLGSASGPVARLEENSIAHQWVYAALSQGADGVNGDNISPEAKSQIMQILFGLTKEGPQSKQRVKMLLTDFAKICKGEMTPDTLLTHSMQ